MKRAIAFLCAAVMIISLAACGTQQVSGNQTLAGSSVTEMDEKLRVGQTTKKEVESWLGTPSGIDRNFDKAGGDRWKYKYASSETKVKGASFIPIIGAFMGGTDVKNEGKILHVDFDQGGVLKAYGFDSDDRGATY